MCLHNRQISRDNFVDKETEPILSAKHFTKFCIDLLQIFGLHGFNLSSFAIKVNTTGTRLTCSLRIETLNTFFGITVVGLLQGVREGLQKGTSHPISVGK